MQLFTLNFLSLSQRGKRHFSFFSACCTQEIFQLPVKRWAPAGTNEHNTIHYQVCSWERRGVHMKTGGQGCVHGAPPFGHQAPRWCTEEVTLTHHPSPLLRRMGTYQEPVNQATPQRGAGNTRAHSGDRGQSCEQECLAQLE